MSELIVLLGVQLTAAVLLASYGWKSFRTESSDGRIWAFAGMIFFPLALIFNAFQMFI